MEREREMERLRTNLLFFRSLSQTHRFAWLEGNRFVAEFRG